MSFTTTELNPTSRQEALEYMASNELDVLVIGAGVVGLAAAGHGGWAIALAVFSVGVNALAMHPDIARLPEQVGDR